jgi:hypothetical protein
MNVERLATPSTSLIWINPFFIKSYSGALYSYSIPLLRDVNLISFLFRLFDIWFALLIIIASGSLHYYT